MIVRLTGLLSAIDTSDPKSPRLEIELGGLTYGVDAPGFLLVQLAGRVGQAVKLEVLTYLEGSPSGGNMVPRMVGFETAAERGFFEELTTVKGIGMRKALRAMVQPPGVVAHWIESGDAKSIATLPEIGKRLAETIVASLRGKLTSYALASQAARPKSAAAAPPSPVSGTAREAAEILVAWGDKPADAERTVEALLAEPGRDSLSAAELVREAYRRRAK